MLCGCLLLMRRAASSMRPGTPYPETPPPFEERFCAECWARPQASTAGPNVGHGAAQASPIRLLQAFSAQAKRHCRHVVEAENHVKVSVLPDRRRGGVLR